MCGGLAIAASQQPFDNARGHYERGDYAEAARILREQAQSEVSPGLLHNLGNAAYKAGQTGEAILAWERARSLDPSHRNTQANLRFARGEAGYEPPSASWYEAYSTWLSADAWSWLAVF